MKADRSTAALAMSCLLLASAGAGLSRAQDPRGRSYRPLPPPVGAVVETEHRTGDGGADVRQRATTAPSMQVAVANPIDLARASETVEVPWNTLTQALRGIAPERVRVADGVTGREIVSQVLDGDGDGVPDALLFQADFAARQTRTFSVQALPRASRLDDPSPVHAKFVAARKDDLAWESDRIAFRVYGPALRDETISNGIDVWVKRVRYPIIEKWYRPGVDYHTDHGEGADLFKVGPTLGCGGTGIWRNGTLHRGENFSEWRILANGPVRTLFELQYDARDVAGLEVRESQRFSLDAGHNLTRIETVFRCEPEPPVLEFTAGLVKRPGIALAAGDDAPWIAMWGPLEPKGNGELGTGVVMAAEAFAKAVEIDDHYLAIGTVRPGAPVVHWAGAGWTRSGDFAGAKDWYRYLEHWAQREAAPLSVTFRR